MLCRISHATIAYPDENVYYTFREQANHPFAISKEEGLYLLHMIAEDMILSRKEALIYQVESDNCAHWVHEKLSLTMGRHSVPRLFWMPLMDTEPEGVLGFLFKAIKLLPNELQFPALAMCHIPFGALQETVIEANGQSIVKTLTKTDFFSHGHIFLPALLNHKIREAEEEEKLTLEWAALASEIKMTFEIILKDIREHFRVVLSALKRTFHNRRLLLLE
jgi:hypothetical protein